jgi:hypothetical protein
MEPLLFSAGGPQHLLLIGVGLAAGCGLFGYGFVLWRRKRLIEDTPTAKIRSMPMGRVELFGRAQERADLEAPLSGRACVYYRYKVEEEIGSANRRRWRTVSKGDSSAWPFYLEDETGRVLVDPEGATVELRTDLRARRIFPGDEYYTALEMRGWARRGWFGGSRRMRVSEWRIEPGDSLYALGVAQERPGLVRERRRRVAEKLAALKRDPEAMAHLDRDGDGHVSADEWEVARRLVVHEVDLTPQDDRVVIGRAPHREAPFYLSDRHESSVVRSLTWRSSASIFGGAALSLGCLTVLLSKLGLLGRI